MPKVYIPEPMPAQDRADHQQPRIVYSFAPQALPGNGWASAALVFGILAVVLTPIPLFIGLVLGGGSAVLAAIFAIVGLTRVFTSKRGLVRVILAGLLVWGSFAMISAGGGIWW